MEKIKSFLFTNINTKQTVLKNTFWLLVSEFGIRVLKLIIFIYATRHLGLSEWGLFSYALALMGFFSIISDIGINTVLQRETARKKEEYLEYLSTGFFLKMGLSLISSVALLSLMIFLSTDNSVRVLIPITSLLLLIDAFREFGFSLNRALEKMEVEAMARISTTALLVILGFIFIKNNPEASSLFYAYIIASIMGIFIMYFSLKKHLVGILSNFKKNLLFSIWKEAWPLGIATGLGAIMASTDIIILGWFRNSEQIGIYSTAQKLTQVAYLFPTLLGTAMLPALSRFAQTDLKTMRNNVKSIIKHSFIFTVPLVIGCFVFGNFAFSILFGKQYLESALIFKIMSLAIITIAPSSIISNAIFAEGKQKKLILFICVSLTTNIILCLLTIPVYGIIGAAFSATIAYTIGNILLISTYKKLLA